MGFMHHEPCPKCGSRNNLAVYTTGRKKCFTEGCDYWERGDGQEPERTTRVKGLVTNGEFKPLKARGIDRETCQKYSYRVGEFKGQKCQIADYRDDTGSVVGQKIRFADKTFLCVGDMKAPQLFGQHLFKSGGRMVVVTEGEIDCLTLSQVGDNKWPVVSIPNGAQGAVQAIKNNLTFLEGFEQVIFMFDMDDPGQTAAKKCAEILSPGKAYIATLPLKDPNEMLLAGRVKDLVQAQWQAKEYRPDGIVTGEEALNQALSYGNLESQPYPWEGFNTMLRGIRKTELVTFCAGSGIGKSSFVKEVAKHLLDQGNKVGYIALEESVGETVLGFLGLYQNKRYHLQDERDEAELKAAYQEHLGQGRIFFYDHFGSLQSDHLLSRIRHMAKALDCDYIFLDHLSIVVSGNESQDERKEIDILMTALKSFTMEANVGVVIVSHLKRLDKGKSHEEGMRPSLAHLRGSGSIAQLSNIVIGLSRNQQGEDPNRTDAWALKNRYTGITGFMGAFEYNSTTGRLLEKEGYCEPDADSEEENCF